MEQEIWKDIVFMHNGVLIDYTGIYQVSNMGRLKSLARSRKCKKGGIYYYNELFLAGGFTHKGYRVIRLMDNMKGRTFYVSRIVAKVFIPNPENKEEVNHKNGVVSDNRVENLEWCTPKENVRHAFATGLCKKRFGKDHHAFGKPFSGTPNSFKKGTAHPMYGKNAVNARLVLNINTGIYYASISEAAKTIGMDISDFSKKLRGKMNNNIPFIFA